MSANRFERLVRTATRRPLITLAAVLALALAGGALSLGLRPSAGSDTFVSRSTASFKATDDDQRHFGADAVIVLIREPLPDLVESQDLAVISQLEACLAGRVLVANANLGAFVNAPAGTRPYGGWNSPCGKLAKAGAVQVVYGPGTFLNRAVVAVNTQITAVVASARQQVSAAERAAYELALGRGLSRSDAQKAASAAGVLETQRQGEQIARLALNSGISGLPRIDDKQFIPQIVFDHTRGVDQPKARFAYLFPTSDSALIQIRLKASLGDAQQARAISLIRQAVWMPMFHLGFKGSYTVTGVPVVAHDLANELSSSIADLLIAAVVVMAVVLMLVFRSRLRLLPLAIALVA